VDAPLILLPADIAATFGGASTSLEDLGAAEAESGDPALQPRAWWKTNAARTASYGIEDSIMTLKDVLLKNNFEVCATTFDAVFLLLSGPYRQSGGSG
jgi:hypothetical protein